ncbi:hypothetical protein E2562_021105 [Oryza meyeriana var. granulata]|uniref:Uncharacterized protein n=1 Tax=Oryza meyeriana var. granulata TaxID=110450 RepID=A0A6G1BM56_9ORYZ|nr:hypothetical protein E2562_021105 [Oryza meyeriana var. granulata]
MTTTSSTCKTTTIYEVLQWDDDTGVGTTSSESLNQAVADPFLLDDDDPVPVAVDSVGGGEAAASGLKTVEAPSDGSDCPICMNGEIDVWDRKNKKKTCHATLLFTT